MRLRSAFIILVSLVLTTGATAGASDMGSLRVIGTIVPSYRMSVTDNEGRTIVVEGEVLAVLVNPGPVTILVHKANSPSPAYRLRMSGTGATILVGAYDSKSKVVIPGNAQSSVFLELITE